MTGANSNDRAGLFGLARFVITGWALLGGLVLLAVVLMNVYSVVGGVFWKPFPGDFEMTQVGIVVAAFAFLPYCQITDANVTADIFTSKASPRWVAVFSLLASLVALAFSGLLLHRMYAGMLDRHEYGYTTTILQFPEWIGYVPILFSLALLAIASLITLIESAQQTVKA